MNRDEGAILGNIIFPKTWSACVLPVREKTVLPPVYRNLAYIDPQERFPMREGATLPEEFLLDIPKGEMAFEGELLAIHEIEPINNQFDFRKLFDCAEAASMPGAVCVHAVGRVAYVFLRLRAEAGEEVTLGMGADCWMQAWINGALIYDATKEAMPGYPPSIQDVNLNVCLKKGDNALVVRFISGKSSSVLALGGPRELRRDNRNSVLTDPLINEDVDPRWSSTEVQAAPGNKGCADIGSRLELFVDDYLIDGMGGQIARRLQHPTPREVVLNLGHLDNGLHGYFAVVESADWIRVYYNSSRGPNHGCRVAESRDGIHFSEPVVGRYEFNGSKENNIVLMNGISGHNFTPFLDPNPRARKDEQFKAVAYHPEGRGLACYVSPDGISWRMLVDHRVITHEGGGFDSQNVAFWDERREEYVCYSRGGAEEGPRKDVRGIRVSVSSDFVNWSKSELVEYADNRLEHMYTNGIRPYPRAPHIYLGTPGRFNNKRWKHRDHPQAGVCDSVLMSSRDGRLFSRWEEGFLRPGIGRDVWTDRNNYMAWGMVQTTPEELSVYWSEGFKHSTLRLRRGTLRTDGFVSLHAGSEVGEMITRPLLFSGTELQINFASSAVGAIRVGICASDGTTLDGFGLKECEMIYGNELAHPVAWNGSTSLGQLAGKEIRLRIRMQDADLYSLRFV